MAQAEEPGPCGTRFESADSRSSRTWRLARPARRPAQVDVPAVPGRRRILLSGIDVHSRCRRLGTSSGSGVESIGARAKKLSTSFRTRVLFVSADCKTELMNSSSRLLPAGQVLEQILALLDQVDSRREDLPPQQRLQWLHTARLAQNRLQALAGLLTAEAETSQAAEQATGTPLTSWIATQEVCSRKEALRDVFAARSLGEHRLVGQAASDGSINPNQAAAIGKVLSSIGSQLDASQKAAAEKELVGLAGRLDAAQLARTAGQVLRKVAPADADALWEERLRRQAAQAQRERFLRFFPAGGSLRFEGSLPMVEGERFQALITAHREKNRRAAIEAGQAGAERPSYDQRQADALVSLCHAAANSRPEPGVGAARVVVKLDYHQLRSQAAGAGLIGTDEPITAGDLRRLCAARPSSSPPSWAAALRCWTLAGPTAWPPPQSVNALTLRDGACAFPGCDIRPDACGAHHITPWWQGGVTALGNLVLLRHHHHGLVEPDREHHRDQWSVHIDENGTPRFTPPARLQHLRQPLGERNRPPEDPVAADSPEGRPHPPIAMSRKSLNFAS